ncbi:MAG: branched-chain amino acid ABC transporter permease [Hydrogenobacter sp.]|uniref:branched-chain amino acid ABC transporter permease n=1 Tax=Hydrogenobacter thermophilus TaxID=940 RepID=UPI0030F7A249
MLRLFLFALFIAGVFLPSFADPYWLRVISSALLLSSLAYAHNLLFHFLGYPAFGGVAFFGIGAYTFSLSFSRHYPLYVSLPFAGIISSLIAVISLPIILRLKSHYFAIGTLALQIMFMELAENLNITGGTKGYALKVPESANITTFYLFLFILLSLLILTALLEKSIFGKTLKVIKEDEEASLTMGINPLPYKLLVLIMMTLYLGILGGVFSLWSTYIDASTVFDPLLSVKTFFVLILSISAPVFGPLAWSFIFELAFEILWSSFTQIHGLLLGTAIILLILFFPKGAVWKSS